jgi:hypothetical protein
MTDPLSKRLSAAGGRYTNLLQLAVAGVAGKVGVPLLQPVQADSNLLLLLL